MNDYSTCTDRGIQHDIELALGRIEKEKKFIKQLEDMLTERKVKSFPQAAREQKEVAA